MREKFLRTLTTLALKQPSLVLAGAAVLCTLAALAVPRLSVSTSRFELFDQAREMDAFMAEFGSRSHLIGAVEAADSATRHAAANALAARLQTEVPQAAEVFYRLDPHFFRDRAFLYLPLPDLRKLTTVLTDPSLDLSRFVALPSLRAIFAMVAGELEQEVSRVSAASDKGESGKLREPGSADARPESFPDMGRGEQVRLVLALIREINRWVTDATVTQVRVLADLFPHGDLPDVAPVDEYGYLSSHNGRIIYLFISPTKITDAYEFISALTGNARRIAADVTAAHPGVTISFTGYPAIGTDEMASIRQDSLITGIVSGIAVMLLFALGFRSLSGVLLVGVPLGVGTLWSLGFIAVTLGGFNLLTQAAAPVLVGLGIDFGVHLLGRYEGERQAGLDHGVALSRSLASTGKGIVTGAVTTSCAFLTLLISDYRAFAELGFITGVGLLLILLATLTVLPALLTLGEQKGWSMLRVRGINGPKPLSGEISRPVTAPPDQRQHFGEHFGKHFGDRFVAFLLQRPRLSIGAGTVLTLMLAVEISRVNFDYNMTALLPDGSESVATWQRMIRESDFSPEFVALVCDTLADVRERVKALEAKPTVARVESIASFIPADQDTKLEILRSLRPVLAAIDARPVTLLPSTPEEIRVALQRLASAAEEAASLTRSRGENAPALNNLATKVRAAASQMVNTPGATNRLAALQAQLFSDLQEVSALLGNSLRAEAVSLADLPPPVRSRFVSTDEVGMLRYAIYAYPKGPVWQQGILEQFVAETQAVDPTVIGYPIAYLKFLYHMRDSLYMATGLASVIIFVLLLADFRSLQDTLLALVPLTCGAIWMVGTMGLLSINYNLANVVALPLLLGIGVDSGVHLVHRYRTERTTQRAVRGILRALVVSAVTTMAGFASLQLAAHRGIQSFGQLLVLGVFCCLAASLWILPPLMEWLEGKSLDPSQQK